MTLEEVAKILLRYLGHDDHKTHSYEGINIMLAKRGVPAEMNEPAITALGASGYTVEAGGASGFGQRLTAKGRRVAKQLRGGR